MWFCTSGTNAFDELGIWREEGGGGRGGKGEGGGKDGMNRVGDKEFKTVVEPVQLSVLMSNFLKVILWI